MFFQKLYWSVKPFLPRDAQIWIRRRVIYRKRQKYSHIWPIDERVAKKPEGWDGWPDGKRFALVLTHDVETASGLDKVIPLAELEKRLGFLSSFNFVAEGYEIPEQVLKDLKAEGFEVGIHGLRHSGNLFQSRRRFEREVFRINKHLRDWGCTGFRAPSMYHDLNLVGNLNIEYDASTFDTDPFEPQPDGVETIFPFWVPYQSGKKGFVELPYTLPQDFTLFVMMNEKDNRIWKQKMDWIVAKSGMALSITHPDYMNFNMTKIKNSEYPARYFRDFLECIQKEYSGCYWHVLPREMAEYWRSNFSEATEKVREPIREIRTISRVKGKRIWIDLDNSPHVPFFRPIIHELREWGHDVFVTTRDCSQTCGLADLYRVTYRRIGRHYGSSRALKVIGTVFRSLQLWRVLRDYRPDLAVSHGSRAQTIAARILGVPSMMIIDYEHVKGFTRPTWVMFPDIIPDDTTKHCRCSFLRYPGIKEEVYVPGFKPDSRVRERLGIEEDDIMVTVRPPATEAHYHNPQSDILFSEAVNYLGTQEGVTMVILPRYSIQSSDIMKRWPKWFSNGKIVIPANVVDGLSLIWASDLVISGGGTMNREAAALGVPVYSIFRGKLGAVDKYLSEQGKLILLTDSTDIRNMVQVRKRSPQRKEHSSNGTLEAIINHILKALET
jgi:hypothetical protein